MIEFFAEDVSMPEIDVEQMSVWLKEVILKENHIDGDINIIFCSDEYLLKVNIDYLKHDYYTDVITFDYTENNIVSGDIFISIERVKDNAKQLGVTIGLEVKRIMVHGVLHLLGYKDKSEEEKKLMTEKENFYLGVSK